MPCSFGGVGFGGRASSTYMRPCLDPVPLWEQCRAAVQPADVMPWWGKANYYECPLGFEPGRGLLLMTRASLDDLDLDSTAHTLTFSESPDANSVRADCLNMRVVRAYSALPGRDGDPAEPMVVEVEDLRGAMRNYSIDKAYNVLLPDGSGYVPSTLNSGSPWRWGEIVIDLWAQTPGLGSVSYGVLPGAPPDGTPENFEFFGSTTWAALECLFTRLAAGLRYDPLKGTFSVVYLGDETGWARLDDTYTQKQLFEDRYDRRAFRIYDSHSEERGPPMFPAQVRVLFRRQPWPCDGSSPFYAITVPQATAYTFPAGPPNYAGYPPDRSWVGGTLITNTTVTLRDDLVARCDDSNAVSNGTDLASRALERAKGFYRKRDLFDRRLHIEWGSPGAGLLNMPGPFCRSVAWHDRGKRCTFEVANWPDTSLEDWTPPEPRVAVCAEFPTDLCEGDIVSGSGGSGGSGTGSITPSLPGGGGGGGAGGGAGPGAAGAPIHILGGGAALADDEDPPPGHTTGAGGAGGGGIEGRPTPGPKPGGGLG